MDKIIYKFQATGNTIKIPKVSDVLFVGDQQGTICAWCLLADADEPQVEYRILKIYATGQPIPMHEKYHGTVTQYDANYIWHVFEGLSKNAGEES